MHYHPEIDESTLEILEQIQEEQLLRTGREPSIEEALLIYRGEY
jgi:hypothetical protein